MSRLDINAKTSALLALDCQVGVLNRLVPAERTKVLSNAARALESARRSGMLVIYAVVQFRDSYVEISANNRLFSDVKENGRLKESQPDSQICSEISPQPGEPIVVKKRIGAFSGSDLEVLLRSRKIDTLVLMGVSTLMVVESTARYACDMDYRVFVLGDCCSDRDPEASEIALARSLPRFSTVCSTNEFIGSVI